MELATLCLFLLCVALLGFYAYSHDQWRKERRELIQRLQSPERASAAYQREQGEEPEPIPPIALDDDQAYEKLRFEREGLVAD